MARKKIYVAGHNGMVGSAICRLIKKYSDYYIITAERTDVDLLDTHAVTLFIRNSQPDYVVVAAAKVGGIHANNTYPADFIYENLMIECNLIHSSYLANVGKLLFLGSSCIYPKHAEQPMTEGALLTGQLEPTNEPYAIAKIAGIKLCESYNRQYETDFRSIMPTNLYGPGDNFSLENSHVIPALLRKFHDAKVSGMPSVEIWGTGAARREFLHVDDMASACLRLLEIPPSSYKAITTPMCSHVNAGYGSDVSIAELAETVRNVVGYTGDIHYATEKPDGAPKKLLDSQLLRSLQWLPHYDLHAGLLDTYNWFLENSHDLRT